MKVRVEILPAPLTPSGTGAESYSIHRHPSKPDRWVLSLRDEDDNTVNVVFDTVTQHLVGQSAVAATS